MARQEYILDGYLFLDREEYERAKKEREAMEYLTANIQEDKKALLKIYNRAVQKESFQTVIGLRFLHELRCQLAESGIVSEDILAPVPVGTEGGAQAGSSRREAQHYQELYEASAAAGRIKNIVIGALVFIIVGMMVISAL